MDKSYLKYSIEDFTQDKKFILFVRKSKNRELWEKFQKNNPEKSKELLTARKIIELLNSKQADIQDEEVYAIWNNIDHFSQLYHQRKRTVRLTKFLRYAAVFIFALCIGSIIPYYYFKKNISQFSEINIASTNSNEAKLILADGAEIKLLENESKLQFDASGEQVNINNDSIVNQPEVVSESKLAMNQVVVPFGKRANLELSDGSKVWLNAGSKLIFPPKFDAKSRRVFLEGEAYFDVSENKNKPFIISTYDVNVSVLGTEFNLSAYSSEDKLEAVLVEGRISLKEKQIFKLGNNEVILEPGQKALYNRQSNEIKVIDNVDVDYYTCWRDGLFRFESESILNVFKRLSRYYNVEFITERSIDVNDQISGKLDLKDSLEEVLDVVDDVAPIAYTLDRNRVFVYDKLNYIPKSK